MALSYVTFCIDGDDQEGDIRLVGGTYSWEGRVEVYLNGGWGTISATDADKQDAHVVCRQLGFSTQCIYKVCRKYIFLSLKVFKI